MAGFSHVSRGGMALLLGGLGFLEFLDFLDFLEILDFLDFLDFLEILDYPEILFGDSGLPESPKKERCICVVTPRVSGAPSVAVRPAGQGRGCLVHRA